MIKTAVDVFEMIGPTEEREIEFKKQVFKENGIRYGALDFSMQLADLLPQTGIPVPG